MSSRKLTSEEVDALMEGLQASDYEVQADVAESSDVRAFQFGEDDLSLMGDYYALRLINERFARHARGGATGPRGNANSYAHTCSSAMADEEARRKLEKPVAGHAEATSLALELFGHTIEPGSIKEASNERGHPQEAAQHHQAVCRRAGGSARAGRPCNRRGELFSRPAS